METHHDAPPAAGNDVLPNGADTSPDAGPPSSATKEEDSSTTRSCSGGDDAIDAIAPSAAEEADARRSGTSGGDAAGRRSRSNSAKSRAWKVKGGPDGGSPASPALGSGTGEQQPSDSALVAAASALAGAAASPSSPPPSSSSSSAASSSSSHHSGRHAGRARGGRRGTKEGQSPSPPQSPHAGSHHDEGASILGHRLQSPWTFWFSRKDKKRSNSITAGASGNATIDKKQDKKEHMDNLVQIGTCRTVEEFWHHYVYIQRASALPKESNLYFFRNQLKPMWETFPRGGCFITKIDKRTGNLDKMWEELLLASIGELFEDPNVVGVEVSIRSKEDGLSVWTRTNHPELRQTIGEKLKLMLGLDDVMYKSNATSIKDRSTYKNAQKILVAS